MFRSNTNLAKAFDINSRSNSGAYITKRLRNKLHFFYFQGEFDVEVFADLDVELMPYVLELVTKTEVCIRKDEDGPGRGEYYEVGSDNLDGVYRLVKNCQLR